jgi:hypothetical protein
MNVSSLEEQEPRELILSLQNNLSLSLSLVDHIEGRGKNEVKRATVVLFIGLRCLKIRMSCSYTLLPNVESSVTLSNVWCTVLSNGFLSNQTFSGPWSEGWSSQVESSVYL